MFLDPRRVLHPALGCLGAKHISNRGFWHHFEKQSAVMSHLRVVCSKRCSMEDLLPPLVVRDLWQGERCSGCCGLAETSNRQPCSSKGFRLQRVAILSAHTRIALSHLHTHTLSLTHTHNLSLSLSLSLALSLSLHLRTHTEIRTHAHTNAHTHIICIHARLYACTPAQQQTHTVAS